MAHQRAVLVVTGIGGTAWQIARRCGSGSHLMIADVSEDAADAAASTLRQEGHEAEALAQSLNAQSRDMREALTADAERRPPVFEGR